MATHRNGSTNGNGLGRMLLTAVVDKGFQKQLLSEPTEAVATFELTDEEQDAVTSIRAGSLPEFAAQLQQWLEQRDPLYSVIGVWVEGDVTHGKWGRQNKGTTFNNASSKHEA